MRVTTKAKNVILMMAAVLIITAAFFLFFQKGAFLPNTINWQEGNIKFGEGRVAFKNRAASIYYEDGEVWHSPYNINVQQCMVSDIDGDGGDELIMLVWKRGSYGPKKPFYVKKNDNEIAQHIFIYKWEPSRNYKLRAIWMSSAISDSINSISGGDDGLIYITDNDGTVNAWYWKHFGLKLLSEDCKKVSLIALGDQLLHMPIIRKGLESGDFSYMYENISEEVSSYDISCLNQETVYVKDPGLISDYPRFGSPYKVADAVKLAGIDIVNLANNHALDREMYGIDCSIDVNESNGISVIGAHSSAENASLPQNAVKFVNINDIKIAFLGFSYGTNGKGVPNKQPYAVELLDDTERLEDALVYARSEADCVVVFAHWGTEYSHEIDENQKKYKDIFLKHGVDVVIGTHPHVLQPYEMLKGENHNMLIYYSLGNLISAQDKEDCLHGGAATFDIIKHDNGVTKVINYDLKSVKTVGDTVVWDN